MVYTNYENELLACLKEVREGGKSWTDVVKKYNEMHKNETLTSNALSKRCKRFEERESLRFNRDGSDFSGSKNTEENKEFETSFADGAIEARKIIEYSSEIFHDKAKLLEYLGYSKNMWDFVYVTKSFWEQNSKKDGMRTLCAIKYKVRPTNTFDDKDALEATKMAFSKGIEPIQLKHKKADANLDDNLLMEIAPVELHLGKLSNEEETGENYDLKIARNLFIDIFKRILEKQKTAKCGKCVIVIGSDFFNSESDNMTTGKTPQENDTRYKKLFSTGLNMYATAITSLREEFNHIDVMLCSGNHARAMEFFMYVALQQYFKDDNIINFKNDYKDTQAYVFGNCGIFYNHGDNNLQRTIKSIPAEFYEVWGRTIYRELHLGHLHKEVLVDDESGIITRRIGSPCATDGWHYQNRFVGATKKHQIFIWHKEYGLEDIYYINNRITK